VFGRQPFKGRTMCERGTTPSGSFQHQAPFCLLRGRTRIMFAPFPQRLSPTAACVSELVPPPLLTPPFWNSACDDPTRGSRFPQRLVKFDLISPSVRPKKFVALRAHLAVMRTADDLPVLTHVDVHRLPAAYPFLVAFLPSHRRPYPASDAFLPSHPHSHQASG